MLKEHPPPPPLSVTLGPKSSKNISGLQLPPAHQTSLQQPLTRGECKEETVTRGLLTTCCSYAHQLCFVLFVYMHMTLCKIHSSVCVRPPPPPLVFYVFGWSVKAFTSCWGGGGCVCVLQKDRLFVFPGVVLHNSVHYASDATLHETTGTPGSHW